MSGKNGLVLFGVIAAMICIVSIALIAGRGRATRLPTPWQA